VNISLGERLRLLREKKDWTQKQAADIFGITSGALSNYERNKRTPDIHTLKNIAEVYGTTMEYIIDGKPVATDNPHMREDHKFYGMENMIGFDCVKLLYEIGKLDEDEQKLMLLLLEGIKARRDK